MIPLHDLTGMMQPPRPPRRHVTSMRLTRLGVARMVVFGGLLGLVVLSALHQAGVTAPLWRTVSDQGASRCRILSVTDGDTVRMWCPGRGVQNARLMGFDTPEVFSPKCRSERQRGRKATHALRRLIRQADQIRMVRDGTDRYDRALLRVWVDDQPVSRLMIKAGHARAYDGGRRQGWCTP